MLDNLPTSGSVSYDKGMFDGMPAGCTKSEAARDGDDDDEERRKHRRRHLVKKLWIKIWEAACKAGRKASRVIAGVARAIHGCWKDHQEQIDEFVESLGEIAGEVVKVAAIVLLAALKILLLAGIAALCASVGLPPMVF